MDYSIPDSQSLLNVFNLSTKRSRSSRIKRVKWSMVTEGNHINSCLNIHQPEEFLYIYNVDYGGVILSSARL